MKAAHLCIDMQNIFAKGGLWETPWMERVLPTIEAVVARYRERTVFSRFIPPDHPEERPGRWRRYFQRWQQATRQNLRGDELDLVPEMARHVPPAILVNKPAYSAFYAIGSIRVADWQGRRVVITGAETDVCVLATALSAVDIGFSGCHRRGRAL